MDPSESSAGRKKLNKTKSYDAHRTPSPHDKGKTSTSALGQSGGIRPSDHKLRSGLSGPGHMVGEQSTACLINEEIRGDSYILKCKIPWNTTVPAPQQRYLHRDDVFSHFTISGGPATIVFPLSRSVQDLLEVVHLGENELLKALPRSLAKLLTNGELLHRSEPNWPRLLIKVSPKIIVKIRPFLEQDKTTEYTSMKHLQKYLPEIPTPRPFGLIHNKGMAYLFMSYIPDPSLEKIWPQLGHRQKRSVQEQLETMFSKLRHLRRSTNNSPLGGLSGEGCADTRGSTRYSQKPIMNVADFTDFLFTHEGNADPTYIRFLRSFLPSDNTSAVVFTHGDFRPANVLGQIKPDGSCLISAIIDWENSGFYPDYFECMKCTNMLSPMGTSDWFEYLPPSIAPQRHATRWLVDRIWDRQVGL